MSIAIAAIAGARETWRETLQYVKDRKAFGQPIGSFQHNRFLLAEMDTELDVSERYVDQCLQAVVDGELSAVEALDAHLERIGKHNPALNAVVSLDAERARERAARFDGATLCRTARG